MADFVGKQFTQEEIAEKVKEQYDDEKTIIFYNIVMGGGGHDIHFGIFHDEKWGVLESSKATTDKMMDDLNWASPVTKDSTVLDLGSGHGGGTHSMVKRFGCTVQCMNLGPKQNEFNLAECKKIGIADKVSCMEGNINNPFPSEWTGKFSHIWSCEVFCHVADKVATLKEIYRCLKPGGVLVFSDLMGSDFADEKQLKDFTDRNATSSMGRPSQYLEALRDSGLQYVQWWDGSFHLEKYFSEMVRQIDENRDVMKSKGLDDQYLNNWHQSLSDRVQMQKDYNVFAWGIFVARKDPNGKFPVPKFEFKTEGGMAFFDAYMSTRSFISGYEGSKDDVAVYLAMGGAPKESVHPHAARWYKQVAKMMDSSFPGASRAVSTN
ncbi:hypothetical protein CYMTET_23003 [Cymbomonas tetramitiformis]|uniref:Methyltransferase type 11 domain-containing protein n=1 Tax=Cymbomonas tetramitiformis TaxID=36881 RepID=A0AAE0L1D2_9CHLO|nr:hypothetical protein CYMTET_23003 [Cymbomonas tetramitiformis]